MKKYKSKIDLWLVVLLSVVFGVIIISLMINKVWIGLAIMLIPSVFVLNMFTSTFYTLDGYELIIKCGLLYKVVVPINDIKRIRESNDLISSPALSIDRLEIQYGKFETVLISPKEKFSFIDAVKTLKPDIEIKLSS
jgi:hypothetical protein